MSKLTLKERIAGLEKRVAELQAKQPDGASKKPWLATAGMFSEDPGMLEIFDEALKLREADRKLARRRANRKPRRVKA